MPLITLKGGPADGRQVSVAADTQTVRIGTTVYRAPTWEVDRFADLPALPPVQPDSLRTAALGVDDVLVYESSRYMTQDDVEKTVARIRAAFGEHRKVLVLDGGAHLSVLKDTLRPLPLSQINDLVGGTAPEFVVDLVRQVEQLHHIT